MTETSISFCSKDNTVRIHTSSKHRAKAIRNRLKKAGASWNWSKHQNGDGSWKFEVKKEDVRHPKYVLKAS